MLLPCHCHQIIAPAPPWGASATAARAPSPLLSPLPSPRSTRFNANHTARDIVAGSCLRVQEPLSQERIGLLGDSAHLPNPCDVNGDGCSDHPEFTGIGSPNEQGAGCKVHRLGEADACVTHDFKTPETPNCRTLPVSACPYVGTYIFLCSDVVFPM